MLTLLASIGRVLLARWPALLAWYLGGALVHYFGIIGAAYAGATSAAIGFLLLPLAILAKLIAFVAMFLVVRDALRELQAIAPLPESGVERRRTFAVTLLASILPFFAIYTAWGFLQDDVDSYAQRALAIRSGLAWQAVVDGTDSLEGGAVLELNVTVLSLFTIVSAFSARWAFKRFGAKLPKWTTLLAVYFEAVWVFFSLYLIAGGFAALGEWVDSRVAMVWLGDIRDWLGAWLVPIAWLWDAIGVVAGNIAGLLVQPLAWLTIAGVIYGQAIEAEQPGFQKRFTATTQKRLKKLPNTVVRWLGELAGEFTSRFRPIVNALVLMWRAGPVLIASYVLLYTIVLALDPSLQWLLSRIVGPQDLNDFWRAYGPALFLVVPFLLEPVRIAVVSGAYDSTLGRLRKKSDQGSIEKRITEGMASTEAISTQNGPSASAGTMNGTIIS
ncbi:hypothetical protein [Microbacterium sp. A93]|uniref:hypothetical protein n=1 Tax=unclassified Microbacterium TaxID=2609290 RepID=UPI003F43C7CC